MFPFSLRWPNLLSKINVIPCLENYIKFNKEKKSQFLQTLDNGRSYIWKRDTNQWMNATYIQIYNTIILFFLFVTTWGCKYVFYMSCPYKTLRIMSHNFLSFIVFFFSLLNLDPTSIYSFSLCRVCFVFLCPPRFQYVLWVSNFPSHLFTLYDLGISTVSFSC